jgi:hypothetical protein
MNAWSSGIVVASTSMPASLVFVGLAAAPDTPSKRARQVVRTRERRSRLLIAYLHGVGWVDAGIAGLGPAIWGLDPITVPLSSQRVVSITQNQVPFRSARIT